MVVEMVLADQLCGTPEETDYINFFQLGFRSGNGTETALAALLCKVLDESSVTSVVLLNLSAAIRTIKHDIFLEMTAGLGIGGCSFLSRNIFNFSILGGG